MKGSNEVSYEDPFDNAPDNNVKEIPVVEEVVLGTSEDGVEFSLTFKGTGGYADRWLVVRFPTAEIGNRIIKDPALKELLDGSIKVAEYDFKAYHEAQGYRPTAPVQAAAASQQVNQPNPTYRPPQQAQEPPSWAPEKPYDDFVYKSGISAKNGKPWHAWMAPQKGDSRPAVFFYPPR